MKNIAIILAAGSGKRLGHKIPKQFLQIKGQSILAYTIKAFQTHKMIDNILVVTSKEYIHKVKAIVNKNKYHKVFQVLRGGQERYKSSLRAIQACKDLYITEVNLIIHDGARPLVSQQIISNCIKALKTNHCVAVAIPTSDTIFELTLNDTIKNIPDRKFLYSAQTPQAFKLSVIKNAYDQAIKDKDFKPTDDCSVITKYLPKQKIFIVKGEPTNIKITYPQDLELLKQML